MNILCIKSDNTYRLTPGKIYVSLHGVIEDNEGNPYYWMSGQIRPDGKGGWETINEFKVLRETNLKELLG